MLMNERNKGQSSSSVSTHKYSVYELPAKVIKLSFYFNSAKQQKIMLNEKFNKFTVVEYTIIYTFRVYSHIFVLLFLLLFIIVSAS